MTGNDMEDEKNMAMAMTWRMTKKKNNGNDIEDDKKKVAMELWK